MIEFLFDTTRAVVELLLHDVLDAREGLRVVVPHSGSVLPLVVDRVEGFRRAALGAAPQRDLRDDLRRLWFDLAGTPFPLAAPTLASVVGESHLLLGTDYCWTPTPVIERQWESIESAAPPSTAASWRHLLELNGAAFLGDAERAAVSRRRG
jgi:hypothetical protein